MYRVEQYYSQCLPAQHALPLDLHGTSARSFVGTGKSGNIAEESCPGKSSRGNHPKLGNSPPVRAKEWRNSRPEELHSAKFIEICGTVATVAPTRRVMRVSSARSVTVLRHGRLSQALPPLPERGIQRHASNDSSLHQKLSSSRQRSRI